MRPKSAVVLFALLTQSLVAQKIGTDAPDITWERTFGFGDVESHKLSDLKGSVIVLEFWTNYSNTCIQEVPKLNKLFAEKGEQGLVVIGVTGDDPALVPGWVTKHAVKYPCATSNSKDYTVTGVPEAIVIDKDFKIAWRGHPAALADAGLERYLVGARPAIVVQGLEEAQLLRKAGDFGGTWKKTRELLDAGTLSERAQTQAKEWLTKIEAFVTMSLAAADKAVGDPYTQWLHLDPLAARYQGVPGTEGAKARLDALLADPKQKRDVEVGKKIAEAQAKEAAFDFDGAYEIYKAAASAFGNTKAGKAAALTVKAYEKDGKLGYMATCPYCKAGGVACPTHKRKKK